jgi:hypothetical protein
MLAEPTVARVATVATVAVAGQAGPAWPVTFARASQLRLRRQGLESSRGRHDSPACIGKADAMLALH